jgi:hypothetical protein
VKFDTFQASGLPGCPDDMTGREYYNRAGFSSKIPHKEPDTDFFYLVDWFWELRNFCEGYEKPITPDLVASWTNLSGEFPSVDDCAIIFSMDSEYRAAMSSAMADRLQKKAGT